MKQTAVRHVNPTTLTIAEDLFKEHSHAEIEYERNPNAVVYTEETIIKLLKKWGLPEPDYEAYAKTAKQDYIDHKKRMLHIVKAIEEAMKEKKLNNNALAKLMKTSPSFITRIRSGANLTEKTLMRIERALGIKLLSH
jgi:HD-like signal output (HDOD) protein